MTPFLPRSSNRGFSLVELIISLAVLSILLAMAAPSFAEYFAKARLRGAADELSNQLALARANAMRQDRDVVVAVVRTDNDTWCAGGRQFAPVGTAGIVQGGGTAACDCSTDTSTCLVAGSPSVVDSGSFSGVEMVTVTGTANLQFDRKVGILADLASRTLSLRSAAYPNRFQLNVTVNPLGHARVCVPTGASPFGGYRSC